MPATRCPVGSAGRFEHAEDWRRHLHLGFSAREQAPLADALSEHCHVAKT
jgi:N-acetylglucosamine malate deacetylase 1